MSTPLMYAAVAGLLVAAIGRTAVLLHFRFNRREKWRRQLARDKR